MSRYLLLCAMAIFQLIGCTTRRDYPTSYTYSGLLLENAESYTAHLLITDELVKSDGGKDHVRRDYNIAVQRNPATGLVEGELDGEIVTIDGFRLSMHAGLLDELLTWYVGFSHTERINCYPSINKQAFTPEEVLNVDYFGTGYSSLDLNLLFSTDMTLSLASQREFVQRFESLHYRAENVNNKEGRIVGAAYDLWVAHDGSYITRIEISGKLVPLVAPDSSPTAPRNQSPYTSSRETVVYELLNVNQRLDIVPIEECP